jgi:1,4-dihydroxy-6-naphthoate synthase
MRLKIGISPCPNDTYIFEALAENKIETKGIELDFEYHDIAILNQKSQARDLDIVKISYANYFQVAEDYVLLRSGGAMGFGVGPLLLSKENVTPSKSHKVAIPGKNTTANFLLQYAFPELSNKIEISFDKIENAVLNNEFDLGLVIHESRFTYDEKGLHKILDLGAHWEAKEKLPIPLGGIAIKRNLALQYGKEINERIKQSIAWQENQKELSNYIQFHAQEMQTSVMQQHIDLYVNDFSKDLGEEGERAINFMKNILLPNFNKPLFIAC